MKKIFLISIALASYLLANDAKALFDTKCAICHKVDVQSRESLIAPPINSVLMHVKRSFKDKDKAIAFIKDYVINPTVDKAICPSIDTFGPMPSQKGVVSNDELEKIANYLYENFPNGQYGMHKGMQRGMGMGQGMGKGMGQGRGRGRGMGRGFMRIDTNQDGFISKDEFYTFRAQREGIDIKDIKYDYFFKKLDKNSDGKLSKDEFMAFRQIMGRE